MTNTAALKLGGAPRRQADIKRHQLRMTSALASLESETSGPYGEAIIRNISPTGILLETGQTIAAGRTINIDLGAAGRQAAQIRWVDGMLLGCQFLEPLTKARVSAALLQGRCQTEVHPEGEAQVLSLSSGSEGKNLGLAIAWARKARGINQSQMARAIGVSTTTICKWERGHAQPRKAALIRLQEYLQAVEPVAAEFPPNPVAAYKEPMGNIQMKISEFRKILEQQLGVNGIEIDIQLIIKSGTSR